ncbi:MAG: RnfABCDGE type electron transport complex subunit D [Pseudanabaenaceae cyanobacterium bins.68]|nr:RnfABCDGE type electron transport complex subunit D [Pseudanabaenaceae cyanobacterium bins.68]
MTLTHLCISKPSHLWQADPRLGQILFLSLFLGLGVIGRDWQIDPLRVAITLTSAVVAQGILARGSNHLSAIITGLSLCLLLRTDSNLVMALTAVIAIASKFIFQANHKHWFNPANFGIIFALIFLPAWVSPGQWGNDLWLLLLFGGLGLLISSRVNRWDLPISFLLSWAMGNGLRDWYLGWGLEVWLHQLSSSSLLLFALFMLTDPRSTPNSRPGRIIWAIVVSLVSLVLQHYFFVAAAPFWALFLCAPLTLIIDQIWLGKRFTWQFPAFSTLA